MDYSYLKLIVHSSGNDIFRKFQMDFFGAH